MLIAGIRRNRYATFLGTDTDIDCVHVVLNYLVRNATTHVIQAKLLDAYGQTGRSAAGGRADQAVAVSSFQSLQFDTNTTRNVSST